MSLISLALVSQEYTIYDHALNLAFTYGSPWPRDNFASKEHMTVPGDTSVVTTSQGGGGRWILTSNG